jgi:N-acetylglucosamine-6-phosphate deacetylase
VLTNSSISADIIADGIHVHPSMLRVFLQSKGDDRAVLITDATAATGMPEGQYMLGSLEVEVRDGKCLHDGKLAGSVLTLDRAVRNAMEFAGFDLQRAVRLASVNPARAVNVDRGVLEAGHAADVVVLSPSGEVKATVVNGVLAQWTRDNPD